MVKITLPRCQPMHGWANRLLRVDLSSGRIWAEDVYDDMIAGASCALARLSDLPPERPVVDHHRQ